MDASTNQPTKKPMGNNLVEKWETLAASWLQVARDRMNDAPDISTRARARAAIYQDCAEELKLNVKDLRSAEQPKTTD